MPSLPGQRLLMRAWRATLSALNSCISFLSQPNLWKHNCRLNDFSNPYPKRCFTSTLQILVLVLAIFGVGGVLIIVAGDPTWRCIPIAGKGHTWSTLLEKMLSCTKRNASEPCTTSVWVELFFLCSLFAIVANYDVIV